MFHSPRPNVRDLVDPMAGGLIVSCQVQHDDPIYTPDMVVKMAEAAAWAGAVGIRANSPEQIRAIKEAVDLPVIGLWKVWHPDTDVFITPTMAEVDAIVEAGADIVGHNIETTERFTPQVRSRARYDVSIKVLRYLADRGQRVKSGLMVGLGESDDEVIKTLGDLRSAGCSIVTIGQYLQPTLKHHKLERYVHPDTFSRYKSEAERMGFDFVASAPMVRSSYMAEQALMKDKSE